MKKTLSLLTALFFVGMAHANDSSYSTNGNTLFPYVNTSIAIDKEVLTIRLTESNRIYYDVDYTFINSSNKEQTILMGFEADPPYPESVKLTNNGHPDIYDFTVEMNGVKIKHKCCVAKPMDEAHKLKPLDINKWKVYEGNYIIPKTNKDDESYNGSNFAFVYYFNATFKPGTNRIRHTYSYDAGTGVSLHYYTSYKLTPATRWAGGKIRDFTLRITSPNTAKHFILTTDAAKQKPKIVSGVAKFRQKSTQETLWNDESKQITQNHMEISMRNATLEWHIANYTPTSQELDIISGDQLSSFFYTDAEREKLSDYPTYYYDSRRYMADIPNPDLYKRLMRNRAYAKRGYVFKDETLKRHFNSLWWYMPDPSYKPQQSDFTKEEWNTIMENK
ncbi:MAG: YARHG domain-containing protein [Bacteroidaceae bacterium]|nr:YARHG domain-containing protein [Bacteroidaceae bacterium]